jgi:hypothetical protein
MWELTDNADLTKVVGGEEETRNRDEVERLIVAVKEPKVVSPSLHGEVYLKPQT